MECSARCEDCKVCNDRDHWKPIPPPIVVNLVRIKDEYPVPQNILDAWRRQRERALDKNRKPEPREPKPNYSLPRIDDSDVAISQRLLRQLPFTFAPITRWSWEKEDTHPLASTGKGVDKGTAKGQKSKCCLDDYSSHNLKNKTAEE